MQKTSINIDDLTHSMASDVSTVANNWDGFWPSTDTKDTKAAVEQNSTRYLPFDSLEQDRPLNAHSHVRIRHKRGKCNQENASKLTLENREHKRRNVVAARRFGEVTKCPTHREDRKSRVTSFP